MEKYIQYQNSKLRKKVMRIDKKEAREVMIEEVKDTMNRNKSCGEVRYIMKKKEWEEYR